MKRLITAVVIIFILAALCISGNLIVTSKIKSIEVKLDKVERIADSDMNKAQRIAKECEEEFHDKETVLCFFANHNKLDELKKSLALIRAHSENKDVSYLLSQCAETEMLIEDIIEDQKISTHSIF